MANGMWPMQCGRHFNTTMRGPSWLPHRPLQAPDLHKTRHRRTRGATSPYPSVALARYRSQLRCGCHVYVALSWLPQPRGARPQCRCLVATTHDTDATALPPQHVFRRHPGMWARCACYIARVHYPNSAALPRRGALPYLMSPWCLTCCGHHSMRPQMCLAATASSLV